MATLTLQNNNTFYSGVMLDRFALSYPRLGNAEAGGIEGTWPSSGTAEITGLSTPPLLLDLTQATPRWLKGAECSAGTCRFRTEAGGRYLALSAEAVLKPSIERAVSSRLRSSRNRYDYLVVGPKALLGAAEPLLDLRRSQGLQALAISTEEIWAEFGFGEQSPQALHDFLAYAYHHWSPPSPRYVLLLGDGSYDYKDFLKTGTGNPVLPFLVKTSYTWTASDPAYASLNGEDSLPDIAIGRLPAATPEEARVMVDKILAHESAGQTLEGKAVLVSDNPDRAGNFEADAQEIAQTLLAGHNPTQISLAQLGTEATRNAILDAFNEGPSLMSYLGHGGLYLWAHESIFNTSQIPSLAPQTQQPLVLTMNCLNGYFHYPYTDSLAEALVKAEGKGAIATFSPSGLSLNDPAQLFHKALLQELLHSNHTRLGDAVLAAQAVYADTGAFPELLAIYHLFGDPALRIR